MIKKLNVNGTVIEYNLEYKNVKNINLRILPGGTVNVSANKKIPQKVIDDFICRKACFILKALEKPEMKKEAARIQYFTETEVKSTINELCVKVYPYFEKREVKFPEIKFRKMSSQWGNCRKSRGILTFSTNLMYVPLECIEYVVYHEFTHFLQPNHSKEFYKELSLVCPDWKERRKKLREISIG